MIKTLTILVALDYITGILKAILNKSDKGRLSSSIGIKCIFKKVGFFIACYLAYIVSKQFSYTEIYTLTVLFFIVNESISIIENLTTLGVPFPKFFKNYLNNINNNIEKSEVDKNE